MMSEHWIWHAVGWFAFALNVWGNMMLTTKTRSGWVVRLACNVCWLPYAVLTGAWALFANHVLFMGINVLGFVRWRNEVTFVEVARSQLRPETFDALQKLVRMERAR